MNYILIKDVYVAGEMSIGRTFKRGEILVLVEDEPLNTPDGDVYVFEDVMGYQAYIPFEYLDPVALDKPCDLCGIFDAYESGRCWSCLDG